MYWECVVAHSHPHCTFSSIRFQRFMILFQPYTNLTYWLKFSVYKKLVSRNTLFPDFNITFYEVQGHSFLLLIIEWNNAQTKIHTLLSCPSEYNGNPKSHLGHILWSYLIWKKMYFLSQKLSWVQTDISFRLLFLPCRLRMGKIEGITPWGVNERTSSLLW